MHHRTLLAGLIAAALFSYGLAAATPELPRTPGQPYRVSGLADRIVLTPGADPARQMAISYRTDARQTLSEIQLAPALDSPLLAERARTISGETPRALHSENGDARYHQVRLDDLQPGQAYVYRVKGHDGWSEWLQFRTARAGFAPFRFIYLGDVQNDILALASRTVRQALHSTASPALVVHAGDLVSQRDDLAHDDEWGEWNQAGGFHYAQVPQLPAVGNHEYLDQLDNQGRESRVLGPHWPLQFALPRNGAEGAAETSYRVDYQGVRFIVLDGTSALDLGTLERQGRWLETQLEGSQAHWNIVVVHQPLFTCARPGDSEPLKQAWQPILERHDVDLVLQGHDHCYSRLSHPDGHARASQERQAGAAQQGPVYLVSVAGSKMYGVNDRTAGQPDRNAEDTQLYQTVEVGAERLEVRSYTASGRLYDAFDLVREGGRKYLRQPALELPPLRACEGTQGPDGLPCSARAK
ncbi:purple acid phosphatase family protein [Stutzerimonas kirkiae]|uniref:purple acid phosphatase family protein n=1 Tax=Stutzerimonas kirkiae TaxID=2211392 RepID=UPI001038468A|nr:metallophosphoesterase family protein [Stutzerimonas kirkiae]TBV10943.1 hydrolase [Stutzerimonas kirkiae]TBV14303.1 hydrolase [Stutzerimonas kirkiae]